MESSREQLSGWYGNPTDPHSNKTVFVQTLDCSSCASHDDDDDDNSAWIHIVVEMQMHSLRNTGFFLDEYIHPQAGVQTFGEWGRYGVGCTLDEGSLITF